MIDTHLNRPKVMIQIASMPHETLKSYHIRYNTERVVAVSPDLLSMLGIKSGDMLTLIGPKLKSGSRKTTSVLAIGGKKGQIALSVLIS